MERGVYFDAWFPGQHCYHPSLPPRRLRMVDAPGRLPRHGAGLGGAGRRVDLAALPGAGGVRRDRPPLPLLRLRQRQRVHRRVPEARHQGLRHRLRGPGLGVPGRAERGRGSHPGAQRAARRRQARLDGAARVLAEPLPEALAAVRALLSRRAGQQRRRAGHRPDRRGAARATSTACPATRTGWSAPTGSTTATRWIATTRSGAST